MAILTHDAIVEEIKKGRLVIAPMEDQSQIREASVDLRLGNAFRLYKDTHGPIEVSEKTDYRTVTEEVIAEELVVPSMHTVLGITMEKITLPSDLAAWIEGRSRFARLGLLIHISAGLIQPGISNHQVLEITNLGPNPLKLIAGEHICQLVFQRTEGNVVYAGRFKEQTKP